MKPGSLRNHSDQEVVIIAKEGDDEACRELIRRYERPVFSLLFRMVRNREQAEDLAQETFVKVINALKTYRPEYKFSSWVFKIANNAAIDQLRKRQIATLSLDGAPNADTPDLVEATALQVAGGGENQLEAVENRELGSAIERAIGNLRPEYRSCIMLRHVDGRSYEEIAEMLDLPLGTVKTYIHRARHELREALKDVKD